MLHLPQRRIGPRIVCTTKNQDDIGATQIAGTGDEGAIGVVIAIITSVADGGSAIGVVGIKLEASLLAEQMPPGLCHIGHICSLCRIWLMIPHSIACRQKILISTIGVAQHRDGATLSLHAHGKAEAQKKQENTVSHCHIMSVYKITTNKVSDIR